MTRIYKGEEIKELRFESAKYCTHCEKNEYDNVELHLKDGTVLDISPESNEKISVNKYGK